MLYIYVTIFNLNYLIKALGEHMKSKLKDLLD